MSTRKKLSAVDVAIANMKFRMDNMVMPTFDFNKVQAALEPDTRRVDEVMAADLNEMQLAFRARAKQEKERMEKATDSEYWFCVCFQSRAQKNAFLAGAGLAVIGDKYLDGTLVAQALGVDLPPEKIPYNVSARVDKTLAALTMTDEEAAKYGR